MEIRERIARRKAVKEAAERVAEMEARRDAALEAIHEAEEAVEERQDAIRRVSAGQEPDTDVVALYDALDQAEKAAEDTRRRLAPIDGALKVAREAQGAAVRRELEGIYAEQRQQARSLEDEAQAGLDAFVKAIQAIRETWYENGVAKSMWGETGRPVPYSADLLSLERFEVDTLETQAKEISDHLGRVYRRGGRDEPVNDGTGQEAA